MRDEFKNNKNIIFNENNEVHYIKFTNLNKHSEILTHGFSTRLDGFSTGECKSLNLGFNRNDKKEAVIKNYNKIADSLGFKIDNMVFSNQVHENKVKIVDGSDRGKGITRQSDIIGYDGLITDTPEVVLVTFYADCVPLFFFDPQKRVIGLSHSGWRSTLKEIGIETVKLMNKEFNCNYEDIEVAIGPSINFCCFEVAEDVFELFNNKFNLTEEYFTKNENQKYKIDLQRLIKYSLIKVGLKEENIINSGICTQCNNDVFFSHRGDKGKTGSLAAFMQLNNYNNTGECL